METHSKLESSAVVVALATVKLFLEPRLYLECQSNYWNYLQVNKSGKMLATICTENWRLDYVGIRRWGQRGLVNFDRLEDQKIQKCESSCKCACRWGASRWVDKTFSWDKSGLIYSCSCVVVTYKIMGLSLIWGVLIRSVAFFTGFFYNKGEADRFLKVHSEANDSLLVSWLQYQHPSWQLSACHWDNIQNVVLIA